MEVVEVLPVDEEVQHVVSLTADLHACLDPVQFGRLEEFSALKGLEETPLLLRFWPLVMETVEYPALE